MGSFKGVEMIWDALAYGLSVGFFTSGTLIFIFCSAGNVGGVGGFVIFITLTFCFSSAAATLFKLIDNIIKED